MLFYLQKVPNNNINNNLFIMLWYRMLAPIIRGADKDLKKTKWPILSWGREKEHLVFRRFPGSARLSL
jgi:hypothetical protein